MQPQSMTHKILARSAGRQTVSTGEFVEALIDICFTYDPVLEELREIFYKEFGKDTKVWEPDKIAFFQGHLVPAKDADCQRLVMAMDAFASEQEIKHYYPYGPDYGICHIVICEKGHVLPGTVILGTDSHTVTHGAFNAFATGVGLVDMVNVFRTGKLWFRVPEVMEIRIDGQLPQYVMAKDIILRILGDIGMSGASYKTIEFTGDTIDQLSPEERMTLCNMTVEAGAKNGIMALSGTAADYLSQVATTVFESVTTDENFEYCRSIVYRAEELYPMVAYPHRPDKTYSIEQTKTCNIRLNQVYVGACTGGKLEDIMIVAKTLRGKKVADGVRLMIVPGSMKIYRGMAELGLVTILLDSGAVIESPGCKACCGIHGGILGDGEVCLSTANRNFRGRMGNPKAFVYLASPYIAARSAIAGYITD